jgi:hypothetical protein
MGTQQGAQNVNVTPGVFCLGPTVNFRLDVNAFTTCRPGYGSPYVQSVRLIKTIPGSQKVPFCYPPAQYFQFGPSGIRTWWALKYTQPGTTFTLEVTTRCLNNNNRIPIPEIHIDRWIWEVSVDTGTLGMVVDMLHSSALSTMEFPCIADELVYQQLRDLTVALHAADTLETGVQRINDVENVIFAIEGFVLTQCVYGDYVAPSFARGTEGFAQPPGNLPSGTNWAPSQFMGSLSGDPTIQGGILDTTENPCCCKLIADVEFLFNVLTGNLGTTQVGT